MTNKQTEEVIEKIGLKLDEWEDYLIEYEDIKQEILSSVKPIILTAIKEAEVRGIREGYKTFIKTVRDTKAKFPNTKDFELVVDVRDIEKSLKALIKESK